MSVIRSDLDGYMSCNHDCNQGRNCPNREPASQEAAWYYISTILAGIGAFSFVMAIVIWSLK
jgi:hypothetical protein